MEHIETFKITILSSLLLVLFYSCGSSSRLSQDTIIEGKFVQKGAEWIQLHFDKDDFVFLNTLEPGHLAIFECCDTISFGKWKNDSNGLIKLNSPAKFRDNLFLHIDVVETEQPNYSADSLYFIINNPIEKHYQTTLRKEGELIYKILPGTNDITSSLSFFQKRFSSNKFSIYKSAGTEIRGFEINVLIDPEMKLTNYNVSMLQTEYYDIKNPSANVFEVFIPDLNFQFLTHKRLNDDYVKVVSKNKLLWEGKEYVRKR